MTDDDPHGFGDEINIEQVLIDDQLLDAIANGHVSTAYRISDADDRLIFMLMIWNSTVND